MVGRRQRLAIAGAMVRHRTCTITNRACVQKSGGTIMVKTVLLGYNGTREGRTGLFEFMQVIPPAGGKIHLFAVVRLPTSAFLAEGFVPESVMDDERVRYQEIVDEGVHLLVERGYEVVPHLAYGEP